MAKGTGLWDRKFNKGAGLSDPNVGSECFPTPVPHRLWVHLQGVFSLLCFALLSPDLITNKKKSWQKFIPWDYFGIPPPSDVHV